MEFFHKVTTYPFMHTRRMWYGVSSVAIIASIVQTRRIEGEAKPIS